MDIGDNSSLNMDISLSRDLLINIGLSGDLLMNIGFSGDLNMDISLSSNLLINIGLSGDFLMHIWFSRDLLMHIGLSSRVEVGISDRGIVDSSIDSTIDNWGSSSGNSRCSSSHRGNASVASVSYGSSGCVAIGIRVGIGGSKVATGEDSCLGRDRGHKGKNGNKGFHFRGALLLLY